jgi:NAD(P)-dependent dehydrogenase (short-subunit alcohol dehydrogenase family)
MRLAGRVAIVTGSGRGIGRVIARRFAEEGASVLVTARTESEICAVAEEISRGSGKAAHIAADVATERGCEAIFREAREKLGDVQILVNNAGIYGPVKALEEISPAEWDEVVAANLRSAFLMSRLVLPDMYARGSGVILNIAAKAAFGLNGPYAASKAGMNGLTRTLAGEAARKGVRVNGISPGPVPETIMSQDLGRALANRFQIDADTLYQQMVQGILQGRPQTAGEIAAAAVFLASEESSAITGQILNVDGGMSFY